MAIKKDWKISASFLRAFKACPTRCRLAYIEGLRTIEDTENQRVGTNWHKLLEIATAPAESPCVCFARRPGLETLADENCPLCHGVGLIPDLPPLDRAVIWLNHCYSIVPPNKDATDWAVERAILANSLAGWLWYYHDDQAHIKTIGRERPFDLPLRNPATGRALPRVRRVGKIDRLISYDGTPMLMEYKSTSKAVDSGSSYWEHLTLDTQISTYIDAVQELQLTGQLDSLLGKGHEHVLIAGTLYDVWHKPGIRPKKLTQGDSKKFMTDGLYCDREFRAVWDDLGMTGLGDKPLIDGVPVDFEPGKKEGTFAIRETPDMFGARLLQDITARPEFYFARHLIARTADQIKKHAQETLHIYQTVRSMNRTGCWWSDESQCEATFKCAYCSICYHDQDVFDGETTPPGFRRIFNLEKTVVEDE